MNSHQFYHSRGFTLVDLLITLSIASILMFIAVPSFSSMYARNQLSSQMHLLFTQHQLARSEAIKNNHRVILCKSHDAQQCTKSTQWHDGWIIFEDTNNNKKRDIDERIIYTQQALSHPMTLKYRGFGSHHYVRYFPDGHTTTNGTFTLCNQSAEKTALALIINRSGRPRIDTKSSSGKSLQCL